MRRGHPPRLSRLREPFALPHDGAVVHRTHGLDGGVAGGCHARMDKRIINPWTWQDRFGFVQAHEVSGADRTLYCAGVTSVDADGAPLHEGDVGAQSLQALDNLETVLSEAGYSLADVVRLNTYVTDVDAYLPASGPFRERLTAAGCRYAATLLGVARLALPQLLIEIEATAVR
jgi:enamine deaminase RidA (YjgF/YER057c/UK114 family)